MKTASIIVIVFAVVLLAVIVIRAQSSKTAHTSGAEKGSADPKEVYLGLRHLALTGSRSKLDLAPTSNPNEPWVW